MIFPSATRLRPATRWRRLSATFSTRVLYSSGSRTKKTFPGLFLDENAFLNFSNFLLNFFIN